MSRDRSASPRSPRPRRPTASGLALLAAFGTCVLGCATPGPSGNEAPLAKGASGRRALVVVVDSSLAAEGARAPAQAALETALALTSGEPDARWSVGVLEAHEGEASVVASLDDVDDAGRETLARKVAALPRGGRPSVARGVRRALDMLGASSAERGSLVLVLAAANDPDVAPLEGDLALRGMVLHRASLASARDAVVDVAGEGFGFAAARSVPPTISGGALAGGRLALLSTGGELPAVAGARAVKGAATDARLWDRLPERLALAAPGDDARTVLLYRPAWELSFEADTPPPIVYLGEPVPVGLLVRGRALPAAASLAVSLDVPGGSPQALRGTSLGSGLRYDGVLPAPTAEGPQRARLTLEWKLGGASFSLPVEARSVARVRTGPRPPRVRVSPARLDLGVAWVGTRVAARLVVSGDPERPTHVELEQVAGVSAAAALELAPGEEKALDLAVDPAQLAQGTRLHVVAQVTAPGGSRVRPRLKGDFDRQALLPVPGVPEWSGTVPVSLEAREASLPETFALGPLVPGGEVRAERPLQVKPRAAVEGKARLLDARGVTVEAKVQGDSLVLVAHAAPDAAPGKRAGTVELALQGSRAGPLTRRVEVEVVPRPVLALEVSPRELSLQGRYGWAEARVQLAANERASLALAPGTLEGTGARITPRRDIRVAAADASWDAKSLEPGQRRELVLRVYLGSDLPPGRYQGALSVRAESPEGLEPVLREIPVALEVQR